MHAVCFYNDDEELSRTVADWLGPVRHQPAIVIATPEHRTAIEGQLVARGLNVERLQQSGALTMLDALETLNTFLVAGLPHLDRFRRTIVPVFERAAARFPNARILAHGEMVDVLWRAGQTLAATRLETFWNGLQADHRFSLLCGYAMANLDGAAAVDEVRRHHSHVVSANGETTAIM